MKAGPAGDYSARKPSERIAMRRLRQAGVWPTPLQRLFAALNEVPWVGVTAVGVLAGAAVQFEYFKSVGHVPLDAGTLTSIAITTAVASVVLLATAALLLAWPALAARMYTLGTEKSSGPEFGYVELISTQLVGAGLLLSYIIYSHAEECGQRVGWHFYPPLIIALAGAAHIVFLYTRMRIRGSRLNRMLSTVFIGLGSLGLFLVVIQLLEILDVSPASTLGVLLCLWTIFVALNAAFMRADMSPRAILVSSFFISVLLFVVLPFGVERSAEASAGVAEFIGVRTKGPVTLLLDEQSCSLVQAATTPASAGSCTSSKANRVEARVLSNVGTRWVIEPVGPSAGQRVRVSIPADSAQVVTRPKLEERNCKA